MSTMMEFNGATYVPESVARSLVNAVAETTQRAVEMCASHYKFDAEEALRMLNLHSTLRMERKASKGGKGPKAPKEKAAKASFPLPWDGKLKADCCQALRQNSGLYTQCCARPNAESSFCKACVPKEGSDGPTYGTIQDRMAAEAMEYVDPSGKKPTPYAKVMKKYKLTKEQVLEEASKFGQVVPDIHFSEPQQGKRGRPKGEPKAKKDTKRGRPKKSQPVLQIEGDDDLFASLVASANESEDESVSSKNSKDKASAKAAKEAEKAAAKATKEAEKATAKAAKEAEKAAKEAEKAAKEAEKAAAKEAEKAAKEAEKAAKDAEKAAAKEAEKAAKEAEKAAKEAEKAAKANKPSKAPKPKAAGGGGSAVSDEPDVVKKIEFNGKKYLKSKKTGVVYDYEEYVKNGDQVIVGKWNEAKNIVEFHAETSDLSGSESD